MAGGRGETGADQPLPRLASVQRADVAGLVVADIDLRECRFAGAHHLDQLQLTGEAAFHRAPDGGGRHGRCWPRSAWRQRRYGWRAGRWGRPPGKDEALPEVEGTPQPGPTEIAGIYRQLRNGRETARNEPGAGGFYYGECEMRRLVSSGSTEKRSVSWRLPKSGFLE
jgi:hypothetical protein